MEGHAKHEDRAESFAPDRSFPSNKLVDIEDHWGYVDASKN